MASTVSTLSTMRSSSARYDSRPAAISSFLFSYCFFASSLAIPLGAALFALGAWLYNRLVADRNQARQGYADIDVQLKRRADLVPQLVEAVRGYAAYEKALLTAVIELRADAMRTAPAAERFGLERALGRQLKQLVLLRESYPQLK